MDRDEAIEWFRSMGVNAFKRDWSLGASILIPVGPPLGDAGITHYENAFYLYPGDDGSWVLLNCNDSRSHPSYSDLESAVRAALEALAREASP